MKFGNLNFLEPSGPLQACNGTDLPLPYIDPNGLKLPKIYCLEVRGLLEKYPTFGREKETGLLGALDT